MKKGYLLVLLTALVSGVSVFLNKFAVSGINPYVFTWSKNILVAVFIVSLILLLGEFSTLKRLTAKQWSKLVMIGLIGGSVPFLLFFKGLSMAPSATAGLLHKSMFILIAVIAVLFLKEKLNKWFIAGAALLFAGNLFLPGSFSFSFGVPELLILCAVVFWAVETVISKNVLRELSSRIVAFGRMFFGVCFITVFLAFTGSIGQITAVTLPQLGWIILTSVLLLGYVTTWYAGLKLIPASGAACVLVLGSAITTLLSFIYAGSVTLYGLLGVSALTAGVLLVIFHSSKEFSSEVQSERSTA